MCNHKHIRSKVHLDDFSALYGPRQVHFSALEHTSREGLEFVFSKALDTFGEISFIVNSTINDTNEIKNKNEAQEYIR